MGLSTKQVSGDHGLDLGQSLLQSGGGAMELPKPPPARRQPSQQQPEPVACPRCASTNTKFCYYNNYNKSQPRHFCKACKRHWTKGGTLRNVPVGGGRKNKRIKTSNTSTAATAAASGATSRSNNSHTHMGIQSQQLSQTFHQTVGDHQDRVSEILYQALNIPGNFNVKSFSGNNGSFLGSSSTLPMAPTPFTFSSLSSFESNPSSISSSFRPLDAYNFMGGLGSMEEIAAAAAATTTTTMPTTITTIDSQQWQVPITSSVMDMPINYWNWDDIDSLVSTEPNNIPWGDENEMKP